MRSRRVQCAVAAGPVFGIRALCERARCGAPLSVSAECLDEHKNRAAVDPDSDPLQAIVIVPAALSVWSGEHHVAAMEPLEMIPARVPGHWTPKRPITIRGALPGSQVCECVVRVTGGGAVHGGQGNFVISAGVPRNVRISPATQSLSDGGGDDDGAPRFVIGVQDEWGNDVPHGDVGIWYQVDGQPAKVGEKRGADGKAKGEGNKASEHPGRRLAGDAIGGTADGALEVKLPAAMFPRGEHEVLFFVSGIKGVAGCVGWCSCVAVRGVSARVCLMRV